MSSSICVGCGEPIKIWELADRPKPHWHKRCRKSFESGHKTAMEFCEYECKSLGLPTPSEIYRTKNSLGWSVMTDVNKLLEKYGLLEWFQK